MFAKFPLNPYKKRYYQVCGQNSTEHIFKGRNTANYDFYFCLLRRKINSTMFSISTGQEMGKTQHIHSAQLVRSFFFLKTGWEKLSSNGRVKTSTRRCKNILKQSAKRLLSLEIGKSAKGPKG